MKELTDEELINDLMSLPNYKDWSRQDIEIALEEYRNRWKGLQGQITNDLWIKYAK